MAIQSLERALESDHTPASIFIGDEEYKGLYACIRIKRSGAVDNGWYLYDIRHDDDDWSIPCEIKNEYIRVNHFGTFYTKEKPLPLKEGESLYPPDFKLIIG